MPEKQRQKEEATKWGEQKQCIIILFEALVKMSCKKKRKKKEIATKTDESPSRKNTSTFRVSNSKRKGSQIHKQHTENPEKEKNVHESQRQNLPPKSPPPLCISCKQLL